MTSNMKHVDSLIADVDQMNLVATVDVRLSGRGAAWYAAAVQVITQAGQRLGRRPEWDNNGIYLRFYEHPHQCVFWARIPNSRLAELLDPDTPSAKY